MVKFWDPDTAPQIMLGTALPTHLYLMLIVAGLAEESRVSPFIGYTKGDSVLAKTSRGKAFKSTRTVFIMVIINR